MKILPVIMAGGSGTRLWPLSRENYPKQFIKIFNGKSLLQHSLLRNKDFGRPVVIVGNEHRFIAQEQIEEIGLVADIILEPTGKNTAPCAVLSALIATEKKADNVLLLPSDHYIEKEEEYKKDIALALEASLESNITTIGISPSSPHTGYGYIELGDNLTSQIYSVSKFVEKPNLEKAEQYFNSKKYCWNSGMFIFRPEVMLELARQHVLEMVNNVQMSLKESIADLGFIKLEESAYKNIIADSIDYAIMEKAENISVVKSHFIWNDLGSFSSIWDIAIKNEENNVIFGDVFTNNSYDNYIYSNSKLTAAVGVKDLVIINTEDATLVASKAEAEKVKEIAVELKKLKREEAINAAVCYRPWGSYQVIDEGELHKVKRIIVKAGHKLSLQYHNHRAEHWVVVKGMAEVEINGTTSILKENDSIYIPIGAQHRLTNSGVDDLHLIEVQTGKYLGEDDIIRLTDVYGRN